MREGAAERASKAAWPSFSLGLDRVSGVSGGSCDPWVWSVGPQMYPGPSSH